MATAADWIWLLPRNAQTAGPICLTTIEFEVSNLPRLAGMAAFSSVMQRKKFGSAADPRAASARNMKNRSLHGLDTDQRCTGDIRPLRNGERQDRSPR